MNFFEILIKLVMLLIIFGCLLFLAYVTTKFIGQKAANSMKSKHMKVLESISLGLDKHLYLVQVGDKNLLIGTYGKNMQYLCNVEIQPEGDVDSAEKQWNSGNVFEKYLNKLMVKDKIVDFFVREKSGNSPDKIRENVRKLKGYTEKIKINGKGGDEHIDV